MLLTYEKHSFRLVFP